MKILNGITQCESVSYKDAKCYMVSKNYGQPYFTATFQSKHILRRNICIGDSWKEPFHNWRPLEFERSILYG